MKQRTIDTAVFTAYLLQGAAQADVPHTAFDTYNGQIGFAFTVTAHARAIVEWLNARPFSAEEEWPGVLCYELVEPLGAYILSKRATPEEALEIFVDQFEQWLRG